MFVYNLLMDTESTRTKARKRKAALNVSFCVKKERNTVYKKVSNILRKPLSERTNDEIELLNSSEEIVQEISNKRAQRQKIKERTQEYEDPANVLTEKCKILADAVINSNHLVVYTGAGISTAACIPDYRGSNGIWTLLQQGKDIGSHDLSQAEPTLTHMALYGLYRRGILKHVVSQNCDGLHLRSGLPRKILSEVHGNMYLEVCSKCKPSNHYWRLFDVTEYTARYSHETLRLCYKCGSSLKDTIVHFGERGKLQWPLNWETACKQADKADVILCLGSSLKVLKKYPWLWCMDKPAKKRPKLYIVNLQWTPKDDQSTLKINGKCDVVIEQMMAHLSLNIPKYERSLDPIFHHATPLHEGEQHTTSRLPIEKQPKTVSSIAVECAKSENESAPSDSDDMSVCSTSQDTSTALRPNDGIVVDARSPNDLITTNDFVAVDDIEMKGESTLNTYSDKENVDLSADEDPLSPRNGSTVKVEPPDLDNDDGQSNLSVISDQSSDYIVPEVTVIVDDDCSHASTKSETRGDHEDESKPVIEVPVAVDGPNFVVQSVVNDMAILQNTALQWYFGCNPWSDLSLFDIFTQKPIFFGPSLLDLSALTAGAYFPPYQSPIFGSYFNCANVASNSSIAAADDNVAPCSFSAASSSTQAADNLAVRKSCDEIGCAFCFERYTSKGCLFYAVHNSNEPLDVNAVCLCCDGEDDDEDEGDEPEENDKGANKVNNVNPGWFGKGYRKKIKKRKRQCEESMASKKE